MANVLSLCQDAAVEVKLTRPSAVIGITTKDERLLARALTKTCTQLQDDNWQKLIREKTFTTVAAETQTDTPLPIDFLRFVNNTIFNRTTRQRVFGPLSDEEWQSMKATAATWSYDSFRIRGGSWLIAPTPTAGQTIAYEYVTSYIGTDATGATPKAAFTVDTDLTYWDDELMVLGIAMNVLDIDGNDYAEKSYQFQARKAKLLSLDGGSRIISPYTRVDKIPQAPRIPDRLVFS